MCWIVQSPALASLVPQPSGWTERMEINHSYMTDSVLEEADHIVSVDRQKDYGHPYDDYTKVAKIASVIFGIEATAEQCAMFMIGVKMSRQLNKHKRDNLVDMAGYVKVLDMIIERRASLDKKTSEVIR